MNKIKLGLLFILIFSLVSCNVVLAEDVLNPNYGTTTFFSEKDEKPSDKPPIYDVGAKADNQNSHNGGSSGGSNNNNNNKNSSDKNDGGLFNQIISGIGGFFSGSTNIITTDPTKNSLFDLQNNSNGQTSTNSADSENSGEFIMGSRGESLDNLDDEEAAKYASRISSGFNFSSNAVAAPKKSKLLFTNIIIPVDMTTQYVLISFVFLFAIGLAVSYYFWKKETSKAVIDPNEDYD